MPSAGIHNADGSIAGPGFRIYTETGGDRSVYRMHYTRLDPGAKRYIQEPWGATISGLPKPVAFNPNAVQLGNLSQVVMLVHGDVIEIDGGVLTTVYLRFDGDTQYSVATVTSRDGGRTWRYLATVAGPDAVPGMREGPCEPSMIRLENGDLMCVARVGGGADQGLIRQYSSDNGKTWTAPDRLDAFSVDPTLRRLENGVIFLAAGRPGIDLWFSTDGRGAEWQKIDLVDYHNAHFPDPGHQIVPARTTDRQKRHDEDQTTAYTWAIEDSPNKLLFVYDRLPFGWHPVPADSPEQSRIHLLPIEVERA
jgi:hypothetical protein